jgi:hypothetical protein
MSVRHQTLDLLVSLDDWRFLENSPPALQERNHPGVMLDPFLIPLVALDRIVFDDLDELARDIVALEQANPDSPGLFVVTDRLAKECDEVGATRWSHANPQVKNDHAEPSRSSVAVRELDDGVFPR